MPSMYIVTQKNGQDKMKRDVSRANKESGDRMENTGMLLLSMTAFIPN